MAYAIITTDKADGAPLRAATRAEHLDYLKSKVHLLIAAGGLLQDDGSPGPGGILLVDTDDRAEAERFLAEDPFTRVGLFQSVTITRWRKAFLDGKSLV